MADTKVQLEIEEWIRSEWMPQRFGCQFKQEKLALDAGGLFEVDAVSTDHKIAACISTSSGKTASGKRAVGKINKLHSDMLFLMMAVTPKRRFIILTESEMFRILSKEKTSGRIPEQIEFALVELPPGLKTKLDGRRLAASREVSPRA